MDAVGSSELPDSCLDLISCNPLTDAVTLVPCGHSFSKETADLLISRRDTCPFDRAVIESYVTAYKIRELVAERMSAEPKVTAEPSLEAVAYVSQASQLYNTFDYSQAIDACIKAMNLCPNYPKAQILLESSLLAQAKESPPNISTPQKEAPAHVVTPSAPPWEPVMPSAPPLSDIMPPAFNPAPVRRLFGEKEKASASDCTTRLELLKVRDEDAFGCLIFLSYLSPEDISEFWLEAVLADQFEISLAEAMSRAHAILTVLAQFQFISYNEKAKTFSLIKKLPEGEQTPLMYGQAFAFFQEFGGQLITNPQLALQRGKEWIVHMEKILQHPLAANQEMRLKAHSYGLIGAIYQDCLQDDIHAVESLRLCVELKKQVYGSSPSPDLASSLYALGNALFKLGDYAASLEYHKQALEMRLMLYGKKPHVEVWESLHSIGSAFCKTGHCLDSIKYHKQALEMCRLLPVSLAYSLKQVADNFYGFGLYEEAVETYQELSQVLEQGVAEDVIEQRADCLNQVGNCYYYVWRCDEKNFKGEALSAYEQALSLYQSLKGKEAGPKTIETLFNVGCVLYRQKKYVQALDFFKQGVAVEEAIATTSGRDFPKERLSFLDDFFPQKSFQKVTSLEHEQQGLILQDFLWKKKSHPHIARTLRKIGALFWGPKLYNDALVFYEQAFKMYQALQNESSHMDIALNLRLQGMSSERLGESKQALAYFTLALAMLYSLYGEHSHGWITNTITWVATTLSSLGEHSEAIKLRRQALTTYQALHKGQPHKEVAEAIEYLCWTLSRNGDHIEAISMLEKSLAMYRDIYESKPHLKIVEMLHSLGNEYDRSKEPARAIILWRQALAMARDPVVWGNNPSGLVYWIDKIASCIFCQEAHPDNEKPYEEARSLYLEAFNIYHKLHKGAHEDKARTLMNIGACHQNLGQYNAALFWYQQSLSTYRKLHGKNNAHPDIVELLAKIKMAEDRDSCVIS